MKKGFTMIELLVVIAIIGILTAVLMPMVGGGTESARNAQCLNNLRSLAAGCHSYGMASGYYPLAGSIEKSSIDTSEGARRVRKQYVEHTGWVSWYSDGAYRFAPQSPTANSGWLTSAYSTDERAREYCITNGALWKFVAGARAIYTCPCHLKRFSANPPAWSYVMNAKFGRSSDSFTPRPNTYSGIGYGNLFRADRLLLFAELPFMGWEKSPDISESAGKPNDCTLDYNDNETIGFNHQKGKRERFAHVVFADGHTETLALPVNGISENNLRDLTQWLCEGKDITFDGTNYRELVN